MFILILGAPGAGKGTQGKLLAQRLGLPKITTGGFLRAAVKAQTPLGLQVKKFMDEGKLVPDSIILDLIKDELDRPAAKDGAVFDGFPRTAAQAELVDRTLAERGQRLNHILLLDVTEEELSRRLLGRAAVEGRSDDTPELVKTRLAVYQRDSAPHRPLRPAGYRASGSGHGHGGADCGGDQAAHRAIITIKSPREIETMAAAGRIVAETLALVGKHARPGVSTEQLDGLAEEFIRRHPGARPSFGQPLTCRHHARVPGGRPPRRANSASVSPLRSHLETRPGDQVLDGAGHQHLARPGQGGHAGRRMHGDASHIFAHVFDLTRVQPRPHVDSQAPHRERDGASALDGPGGIIEGG